MLTAPFRVAVKPGLPLTVLIACLAERVEIAKAQELAGAGVGCMSDLIEQTIPHLKRLEEMDGRRA